MLNKHPYVIELEYHPVLYAPLKNIIHSFFYNENIYKFISKICVCPPGKQIHSVCTENNKT